MERGITPKQLEILKLLAEGLSSEEIAKRLGNSKRTIESIRLTMMERTGVKNVAQLIVYGFRNGYLE